jgi:hypothetical protein
MPLNPWKLQGYKPGQNVICKVTNAEPGGYAVIIPKDGLPGFLPTQAMLRTGEEILAQYVCVHNNRILLSARFSNTSVSIKQTQHPTVRWEEHLDEIDNPGPAAETGDYPAMTEEAPAAPIVESVPTSGPLPKPSALPNPGSFSGPSSFSGSQPSFSNSPPRSSSPGNSGSASTADSGSFINVSTESYASAAADNYGRSNPEPTPSRSMPQPERQFPPPQPVPERQAPQAPLLTPPPPQPMQTQSSWAGPQPVPANPQGYASERTEAPVLITPSVQQPTALAPIPHELPSGTPSSAPKQHLATHVQTPFVSSSDPEAAFNVWAKAQERKFHLKRATDLILPPLQVESENKFKIADYDLEWLITDLEGGMRTGCVKAASEERLSRSAMLLYRGRAVGCIYGCKSMPETQPTEQSLQLMLSDLELPETSVRMYDLPESVTLAMSALFLGYPVQRNDEYDAMSYMDYICNWFESKSNTACLAITLNSSSATCLGFIHKGQFCGAFYVEDQKYTTDVSFVHDLLRNDPKAGIEASILPPEMTSSAVRFGFSLSMARQRNSMR